MAEIELISSEVDDTLSIGREIGALVPCLLYTSDAADERSSVDLGGRRIIKKKKENKNECFNKSHIHHHTTRDEH